MRRAENKEFLEQFQQLIGSEPKRTVIPKLVSPEEMKSIWRIAK